QQNHIQEKFFNPESTHNDVLLQVIEASSNESVSEAAIGTAILLEMNYALQP
ncbi:unnamed protein product, partial [Candidula unifasciata]